MSIKPKILCPPDYSILSLRFAECKKLGVVKGTQTLLQIDLSNFYIPLTNYSERKFTIKAGQSKKLDIGDLASYWDLKEAYSFVYNNTGVSNLTTHRFSMYDETGMTLLGQMSFTVDVTNLFQQTFAQAFEYALQNNVELKALITASFGPAESQVLVTASTAGIRYRYMMEYDINGFGGTVDFPYMHPGTLVTKNLKYPEGRVRAIFIYPEYAKADTSTCGGKCMDTSGDLLSNVKNFKWAYDSDYTRKQNAAALTGVIVNSNSSSGADQYNQDGTQTFQWLATGNAPGYVLNVGDLVTLNTLTDNPYGYVTNIDGYNITVDRQGFGTGMLTDQLVKKWSPTNVEWRVAGEMLFLTGGQDVYDADRLYTETIWINNPQAYDVPFTAMIIS